MHARRSLRLAAGALVLALPLLGSCGFDKATDRVYTPAEGVNNRDGQIDVLAAVVVAAQPNSGTFLASLSNNGTAADDGESLDSIASDGDTELTFGEVPDGELPPRGFVNLLDLGGITVQGEFEAGQTLPITLTFAGGDSVSLDVPVVYACDEYTGLDESADLEATETPSADATADPSASPSASASASPAVEPGEPYDCGAVLEEGDSE